MKIRHAILSALLVSLSFTSASWAQTHAGRMDTDGRLSPGEVRNPRIAYGHGHDWDHGRRGPPPYYGRPGYPYPGRYIPGADRGNYGGIYDYRRDYYDNGYDSGRGGGISASLANGIRSGKISRAEEFELRQAEADLRSRERDYMRDGRLSDSERRDLRNRESALNNKLNHELNDGEKRW